MLPEPPLRLRPQRRATHNTPGPLLRRARDERHQRVDHHALDPRRAMAARQIRAREAGADREYQHVERAARRPRQRGQLLHDELHEQLRRRVLRVGRVRRGRRVVRLQHAGRVPVRVVQGHALVAAGAHDLQDGGAGVAAGGAEDGDEEDGEERGAQRVDLQRVLPAVGGQLVVDHVDAGVQDGDIEARQLRRAGCEGLDAVVGGHVQIPYFNDVRAAGALLDGGLRARALGRVAHAEDHAVGVQRHELGGGLEAEPGVGAGDQDGVAGEGGGGLGRRVPGVPDCLAEHLERHRPNRGRDLRRVRSRESIKVAMIYLRDRRSWEMGRLRLDADRQGFRWAGAGESDL